MSIKPIMFCRFGGPIRRIEPVLLSPYTTLYLLCESRSLSPFFFWVGGGGKGSFDYYLPLVGSNHWPGALHADRCLYIINICAVTIHWIIGVQIFFWTIVNGARSVMFLNQAWSHFPWQSSANCTWHNYGFACGRSCPFFKLSHHELWLIFNLNSTFS